MTARNQINNDQLKIIIDKANSKPIIKRGRLRKYHTEEERRAAINQQLREYRQRKKRFINSFSYIYQSILSSITYINRYMLKLVV